VIEFVIFISGTYFTIKNFSKYILYKMSDKNKNDLKIESGGENPKLEVKYPRGFNFVNNNSYQSREEDENPLPQTAKEFREMGFQRIQDLERKKSYSYTDVMRLVSDAIQKEKHKIYVEQHKLPHGIRMELSNRGFEVNLSIRKDTCRIKKKKRWKVKWGRKIEDD
jgi:hypothetical protein